MELPVDILPEILSFLAKPSHLASACLVNKTFHKFAVRQLYDRISIVDSGPIRRRRAIALFTTLARSPELARLVHHLEIRNLAAASHIVLDALPLCTNLRSWTGHHPLTSDILLPLSSCPELRELEFDDYGNCDRTTLLRLRNLNKLSISMRTQSVLSQLPDCFALNANSLRSLALTCQVKPISLPSFQIFKLTNEEGVTVDHRHPP